MKLQLFNVGARFIPLEYFEGFLGKSLRFAEWATKERMLECTTLTAVSSDSVITI